MSVDDQIEYWREASVKAETKEAAVLAHGVMVGLKLSKQEPATLPCPCCGRPWDANKVLRYREEIARAALAPEQDK